MINTKYFYIAELVQMPVLTAHYGDLPYKFCLYGEFLNLYSDGQGNSIFYHWDYCTEPTLRSDMDPNMQEYLLRP
jgi:hypothetical protein